MLFVVHEAEAAHRGTVQASLGEVITGGTRGHLVECLTLGEFGIARVVSEKELLILEAVVGVEDVVLGN